MKTFYTKDGKNIVNRLSRWITIKQAYNVNRSNSLFDFSTDAVLMVLASELYDEADYIRNYDEFLEYVKGCGDTTIAEEV